MKIHYYAGNTQIPYRSLMAKQEDFMAAGVMIPVKRLVIAEQTHSDLVHICTGVDAGAGLGDHPQIPIADALISNCPDLWLLVRTADCTPVFIWDERQKVVCAIHSGREGTRKNICKAAIDIAISHYHSNPEDLKALVGAGISYPHYEVSSRICDEFYHSLAAYGIALAPPKDRHPDIRAAINAQLQACGLSPQNIINIKDCTYENPNYFSFRKTATQNRQINIIGVCNAKNL